MKRALVVLPIAVLVACSSAGSPSDGPDAAMPSPDLAEPVDSTDVLADDVLPCEHPEYWPYALKSQTYPATVHYRLREEADKAQEVLGYLEHSWHVEVEQLGFRPPLDDGGKCGADGSYDVFMWRDHAYGNVEASYTDTMVGDPVGPYDSYPTFFVIDPWGVQGGSLLDATMAHELNHACQAADEWLETPPIYEMTSQFIEDQVYDDNNEYASILYDFQAHPDWSIDKDDSYASWYMYGAAMYLFYLRDAHWGGDATFISDMWLRMRKSPTASHPNYQDALDAMLKAKAGIGYFDSVVEFARWRWFTNSRDDGKHFEEGAQWPASAKVALAASNVSPTAGSVTISPAPMLLGSAYVEVVRGSSGPATTTVKLEAPVDARVKWVVQAIPGMAAGSDGDLLDLSGGSATIQLPAGGKRILVVTALPTGAYAPDTRDDTRFAVALHLGP